MADQTDNVVSIGDYKCASCGGRADMRIRMRPEALTDAGAALLRMTPTADQESGALCVGCCVRHAALNTELKGE